MLAENVHNLGNRNNQHSFAQIPNVNQARSTFDRSHALKTTFDFDYLVPIYLDEVLPGDTINLNVKSFARLATQVLPAMDNMYLDYFFFYVPTRLLWENWEKFNGAQDDPTDSIDFAIPVLADGTEIEVGEIGDHFGLPTDVAAITTQNNISALPFRAYNLIYNSWFRDQNLIDSVTVNLDDGPDAYSDVVLMKRAKKHDYFTSSLPAPQRGDAVSLPLGTSAPVVTTNSIMSMDVAAGSQDAVITSGGAGDKENVRGATAWLSANENLYWGAFTGLETDLSLATASTLNAFRNAIMVQSLLELDARGGTRYVEILRAHFNVVSPDFRLQRPEFLSGGSTSINQHPIPQTSESNTTLQGNLAAFSTAGTMGKNIGFSKSFVEHGYVIGLIQARADVTYQQGINKLWTRETRYDFFWPKLQELGEQSVLNKEIYAQGTAADDTVFGYQERYAEYRYAPSKITGQFRSTYASSLDVWTLAEEFSSLPALNETFINSTTPIERNLAVTSAYPHILFDGWFDQKHARPMMTTGVPATLGRF